MNGTKCLSQYFHVQLFPHDLNNAYTCTRPPPPADSGHTRTFGGVFGPSIGTKVHIYNRLCVHVHAKLCITTPQCSTVT